jgi:hypothetical protein
LGEKLNNSLTTGPNSYLQHFKNKTIFNFWLRKKGMTIFFHHSLLLLLLDPGWVKIRIRDKHPGSATLVWSLDDKKTRPKPSQENLPAT